MVSLKNFTDNFPDISKDSLNSFIDLATEVQFRKNVSLTKVGEVSNCFFIIKSGIVRSYYTDEKGKEYTRTIFVPGKTTGSLSSLISGLPSKLTYECLTKCVVYKFYFEAFNNLKNQDPQIEKLYSKMLEYIFLLMESRIHDLAVLNATQRYLKLKREIPNIETMIPQYHIASYLNVSAVQLSRIRKEIYSK
jgi:CRP-like cAMP-binding protein